MRIKLIFIRHGETDWTEKKRLQGRLDIPLNKKGKKQIEKTAVKLRRLGVNPSLIVSSPLRRARQSAVIIANIFKIPFTVDKNLSEKDLGELAGKTRQEVKEQYNLVFKQLNGNQYYDYSIYGGESIEGTKARIEAFLNSIERNYKDETIIVVTHAGILRFLFSEFFSDIEIDFQSGIKPGSYYILEL